MDNIRLYAKMSEKAIEIQEIWKNKDRNEKLGSVVTVIWKKGSGKYGPECCILQREPIYGIGLDFSNDEYYLYNGKKASVHYRELLKSAKDFEKLIWLPRQDELQEMFINSHSVNKWKEDWLTLTNMFNGFISWWDTGNVARGKSKSMEQLWFMFLMKKKYDKVWSGKNWIKDEE